MVLSMLATWVYVRSLGLLPIFSRVVLTHGALVAIFLSLFLTAWGTWAGGGAEGQATAGARVLSVALIGGLFALNLVYLLQIIVVRIWCEPLKPALVPTLIPQLKSLVAAVGPVPYWILGFTAAAFTGSVIVAWWQGLAIEGWIRIDWSIKELQWMQGHLEIAAILVVSGMAALILACRLGRGGVWLMAAHFDPILCIWTWKRDHRSTPVAELTADMEARRNYRTSRKVRTHPTVVVVTIDCWRWDHLGVNGYPRPTTPFLQELRQAGQLQTVERAVGVSNASRQGIMGILASRPVEGIHMSNFRLHDVLKAHGYRTHFLGSGDHSTFENLRSFYGDSVDVFRDGLSSDRFHINDDRTVVESIAQLPDADATPSFFYLHLMSPHEIGVREPESAQWPAPGTNPGFLQRYGNSTALVDSYDNGVLQADRHLRRIFELLKAKGYLNDYIAVLTADHGQSLGEHGIHGHRASLHEPEIRIPLFFVESDSFAYPNLSFASQLDIAPTLLDRLGMPRPKCWAGQSLLESPRTRASFTCASLSRWSGETQWRGLIEIEGGSCLKYLYRTTANGEPNEQIYDLVNDPAELHDIRTTIETDRLNRLRHAAEEQFSTETNRC